MSNSGGGAHILVFPYPAQGHMLPLLDLTHQLAVRGLTITILATPKNLPILNPLLSKHPSIQTLVFPFPTHPSIPPGVENVKDIGNHGNVSIIRALSELHDPIKQWFKTHPSPPVAILSDFFLGWTQHLATLLGVPRIAFYSSGAFLTSVLFSLSPKLGTLQTSPVVPLPDLPNSPSFPLDRLPSILLRYRESEPDWVFVKESLIANMSSWGSVLNTFDELEGIYLNHLRKKSGHHRVWGVGPLVDLEAADRGGPSSVIAADVLNWLDGCPDGSVIFVSFGSQFFLGKDQMQALAAGLEGSGARFIWSVKSRKTGEVEDDCGEVLTGLEDRIAGKGLILKGWVPQVSILNHRAVGGFLTHCGWNSVIEGIMAGVLLLTWSMEADQHANARLLVKDLGVAVRVAEGIDVVRDSVELARIISDSLCETGAERVRAMEMRSKALDAVKEDGSSSRDLDGLVKELYGLTVSSGSASHTSNFTELTSCSLVADFTS